MKKSYAKGGMKKKGYAKGGMKKKGYASGAAKRFLDLDRDGNKTESMKSTAVSKKGMKKGKYY